MKLAPCIRKALSFLLAHLMSGCMHIPSPPVWPNRGNVYEGIGFAQIKKSNYKKARDEAFNDALKKLSSSAHVVINNYTESILKSNGETSNEGYRSYLKLGVFKVLGNKYYDEYIDERGNYYWVRVWMKEKDFEEGLKETARIRKNLLQEALSYYDLARELPLNQPEQALIWHAKASKIIEEIHGEADLVEKDGKKVNLYYMLDRDKNELRLRIKKAEHLYEKSQVALKESRLNSSRKYLEEANELSANYEIYDRIKTELEKREKEFTSHMEEGDNYYTMRKLSKALKEYEKAREINDEDERAKFSYRETAKKLSQQRREIMLGALKAFFALILLGGLIALATLTSSSSTPQPTPHPK